MDLCNILNIKLDTLKKLENKGLLQNKLNKLGYKYISKFKEGRNVYYNIELVDPNKELYSNMCKYLYNTNKELEFSKYFTIRTLTNNNNIVPLSVGDIANNINVNSKTITKWDNTLIDNNIIVKDGYYYFCIDKNNNTIKQCTKEEYKNFWRNKAMTNIFKDLQLKYIKGIITLEELTLASAEVGATYTLIENKYYYRIKKYITNIDNKLYIDTLELIKDIYSNNKEYTIELL